MCMYVCMNEWMNVIYLFIYWVNLYITKVNTLYNMNKSTVLNPFPDNSVSLTTDEVSELGSRQKLWKLVFSLCSSAGVKERLL